MFLPDTAVEPNIRFLEFPFIYRVRKIMVNVQESLYVATKAKTERFRLVLRDCSPGEPGVAGNARLTLSPLPKIIKFQKSINLELSEMNSFAPVATRLRVLHRYC